MTRNEVVAQLSKMYGAGSFYSNVFFSDRPAAEIFFHNKTGFSIGMFRLDTNIGYVNEPTGLQATYRI